MDEFYRRFLKLGQLNADPKMYIMKAAVIKCQEELLELARSEMELAKQNHGSLKPYFATTVTESLPGPSPRVNISRSQNRITIPELINYIDNRIFGKFLLCRTIMPPFIFTSLQTVVDDPDGTHAARLCLYNYTAVPRGDLQAAENALPVGTILCINNPFFKRSADGRMILRQDNPADVILIDDATYAKVFPCMIWKEDIPMKYRLMVKKSTNPQLPDSVEMCRVVGNKNFVKKDYIEALKYYNQGLNINPDHKVLLSNRSVTHLNLENFEEAIADAEAILLLDCDHVKAKYRKAMALLGLKKYDEAVTFLNTAVPEVDVTGDSIDDRLVKLKFTLEQQLNGIYDEYHFKQNCTKLISFEDCAEYFGPFVISECGNKGLGVKATAKIKEGELVIVSKAFSVYYDDDLNPTVVNIEVGPDNSSPRYFIAEKELVQAVIKRLVDHPELGKTFYSLFAGKKLGRLSTKNDDEYEIIDVNRITKICKFNAFCSKTMTSEVGIAGKPKKISVGIWIEPSFLNHSCVPNCKWITYNNLLFLRATSDIEKDEELLILYVPDSIPYQQRVSHLELYEFKCECKLCILQAKTMA